jgi:hypothetical protein
LPLGSATLRKAIKVYGGPVNGFAADVLGRSRVSVWRWINDRETIPLIVVHRLKMYLRFPHPTHADVIALGTTPEPIIEEESTNE